LLSPTLERGKDKQDASWLAAYTRTDREKSGTLSHLQAHSDWCTLLREADAAALGNLRGELIIRRLSLFTVPQLRAGAALTRDRIG